MEQGIPFHQEVECEACHTDLTGKAEVTLLRGEMELQADYDGEPRMVRIDAVLDLLLRYFEDSSAEVLCDAYSLAREILPKKQQYEWDFVQSVSDSRDKSGRTHEAERYRTRDPSDFVQRRPRSNLEHTEQNEQGMLAQGTVELWVLYATSDDAQPLACAMQSFPFEHTAELQDSREKCEWQVFLCLDQLTVSMLDARELEMKAVLQMQILFCRPVSLELVEDLEEEPLDMDRLRRMPGMSIHIVQPDESLWNIAKTHATSCEVVMELNDLKEDALKTGQKLLIVKEAAR